MDTRVSPPSTRPAATPSDAVRTVFMFSGQGSQYYHMGRRLYEREPVFRDTLDTLDAQMRRELGESVLARVYASERRLEDSFDDLRYTQPAIFMVEYALARLLASCGVEPDVVVGASLGELAAAAVAGALDPGACLGLIVRQVELFEARCPRGGMLAVLADPALFEASELLRAESELAAINSRSNFVVAGREPALARVEQHLARDGILYQRLPVRFPFHSSLIDTLEGEARALLRTLEARPARVPLISCTTGTQALGFEPERFWDVLRRPFCPGGALAAIEAQGPCVYLDLGPSGTLSTLAKSQLPPDSASRTLPLMSPYGNEHKLVAEVLRHFERSASGRDDRPSMPPARSPEARTPQPALDHKLRVYAFPGQGAQFKGMGRELFERFGVLVAKADAILGYSICALCVDDPQAQLGRTEFTQPALFVVNALSYLAALQEGAVLPDYLLGHSLGEYDALWAAGAFDFETGLRLVKRRAELMGHVSGGSMAAVVGLEGADVRAILDAHALADIDIANFNAPGQVVLAGPRESLRAAAPHFERASARCITLNVSAPFHSRYMEEAAAEFGRFLEPFELAAPKLPVIANVDARPYDDGVKGRLAQQIARPVLWTDSIRYLMGRGTLELTEIGPGRVLTGLVTKILAAATPLAAEDEAVPSTSVRVPGDRAAQARTARSPGGQSAVEPTRRAPGATALSLGSRRFREDYGVRYAYVAGGMHHGISSRALVARMAGAGFMAYFGAHGLPLAQVEDSLRGLQDDLGGAPFGVNLTYDPFRPQRESELVELCLRRGARCLEVAAYPELTPALVKYRLSGLRRDPDGRLSTGHKILAKVSRPEIARQFLAPAPERLVRRLREREEISAEQAESAVLVAMADDVCAQADAGGHTEMGVMFALLPSILRLREEVARDSACAREVRVGASGGIGTAEAAAAAFLLGAEFILTGSVNQCTVEAATSARAKDLLQHVDVQDSTYAPSGELFELGARVRVMKRGVLFHARAARLHDLWRNHERWEDIDAATRRQVEERYLRASFEEAYAQARRGRGSEGSRRDVNEARHRMALVFRWYCERATLSAIEGAEQEIDYQIYCGPALGAFNRSVQGTQLESWRERHVDQLALKIMEGAAARFNAKWDAIGG